MKTEKKTTEEGPANLEQAIEYWHAARDAAQELNGLLGQAKRERDVANAKLEAVGKVLAI